MNLLRVLILSIFCSNVLYAQLSGTISVCPTCTYPDLTSAGGAFAAINSQGLNGNLILEIQDDLSEPGIVSLNAWSEIPVSANWTLNIRPDGNTMRTISNSGATSGGLIRISGAHRVTIDGRDPANTTLDFTNRFLTFINTETNSPAFSFTSDATFNAIRSCIIEGANLATNGGVVSFGGGPTTGNDNNAIQYCDIKNATTNPRNAIYSSSSNKSNDNVAITFNRIYNFYSDVTGTFNGIFLSTNNDGWTIEHNSFYQQNTLTTALTNQRDLYAIHVNNTGHHSIQYNYIGGDSPDASIDSQPWSISYSSATLRVGGIWIEKASTTEQTLISSNTITNLTILNSSAVVLNDVFFGINAGIASDGSSTTGCRCSVEDNYIGAKADGTGAIIIAETNAGGIVKGIDVGGPIKTDVLRNSIKNISISASEATVSSAFIGIDFSVTYSPFSDVISNNVESNSVISIPTSDQTVFAAIRTKAGSRANLNKNLIGSLTDLSKENIITINSCSSCTASYTVSGICASGLGSANSINRNIVGNITLTGTTSQSNRVSAIRVEGDIESIQKNTISNIKASGVESEVYGIYVGSMSVNSTISNNMITLGLLQTVDVPFIGIYNDISNTTSLSVLANSVAITGPGGVGNSKSTFAFYRNSDTPVNIIANLLFNDRSGDGDHFAIGTSSLTNWSNTTSNYNLLFAASSSNTGFFGIASQTFADWQAATVGDLNSTNYDPSPKFISLSSGDLRIPDDGSAAVNNNLVDKGGNNAASNVVLDDIDGAQRLDIVDIGASEVLINWIGGAPGLETDWFTAANWSGGVPSCGTKDRIKIRPTNFQPELTGAAEFRDMVIIRDATLNVSGTGSLTQCPDAESPFGLVINGSLIVTGSQPFTVRGDFTQNNVFDYGTGNLILDGSSSQYIRGDYPFAINNITVDGGGPKILEQKITVNGALMFVDGVLNTTQSSVLTLATSASYTGSSATAYVDGPLAKKSNSISEFVFPVGKNGFLRAISITPNNTLPTTFTAEYFHESALDNIGSATDGSLLRISDNEYWVLDRSGLSDAYVKLNWDSRSGVSANAADRSNLRVAHWNGVQWNNEGGSLITGTQSTGSVTSDIISSFSPFTLGSEVEANPLPIELLSFTAEVIKGKVKITWVTTAEFNNDYFTIESLTRGDHFQPIATVSGKGTTREKSVYTAWDNNPTKGLSYYRLKQTDRDRKTKAYPPTPVTINDNLEATPSLSTYPNPIQQNSFRVTLTEFDKSARISIRIIDLTGKVHLEQTLLTDGNGEANLQIANTFASGLYLIQASNGIDGYVHKISIIK